jgi:hypothetical protein
VLYLLIAVNNLFIKCFDMSQKLDFDALDLGLGLLETVLVTDAPFSATSFTFRTTVNMQGVSSNDLNSFSLGVLVSLHFSRGLASVPW